MALRLYKDKIEQHIIEKTIKRCEKKLWIVLGNYSCNLHVSTLQYIFPEFTCHSPLRRPHPDQSPTNCDVHLVENFF